MEKNLESRLLSMGLTKESLREIQDRTSEQILDSIMDKILENSNLKNYGNHGCTIYDEDIHPDPAVRARIRNERLRKENEIIRTQLLHFFPYIKFEDYSM